MERRRIMVVCGPGGVGKTSVSAAIAMALAQRGKRTVALTVDPARRLATALGVGGARRDRATVKLDGGASLDVQLLDTKRTFDQLVERHAGSAERRDRILENLFYQRITTTLSGTHEYMAMERLYELATEEDWDAVVIDTPPTRSALSFLDAPKRMTDFLGGRVFRWLLWPYRRAGRTGMRGASAGARLLASTVGRIAGTQVLTETAEFLAAFEGMYEGFKERAAHVVSLLAEEQTGFVVVTAPESRSIEEAAHFVDRVESAEMHLDGVVVNRFRRAPRFGPAGGKGATRDYIEERVALACLEVAGRLGALEERGAAAISPFREAHPHLPMTIVPELPVDVHDRAGLSLLADELLAPGT